MKRNKFARPGPRGFTLIELLVVIAIIAILQLSVVGGQWSVTGSP